MCVYLCIFVCVCVCLCVFVCICVYMCVFYVFACICTYVYVYVCICTANRLVGGKLPCHRKLQCLTFAPASTSYHPPRWCHTVVKLTIFEIISWTLSRHADAPLTAL